MNINHLTTKASGTIFGLGVRVNGNLWQYQREFDENIILDEGTIIDRYSPVGGGSLNNGTYFSEPGVPYPNRSLPYNPTNVEYGRWKLKIPLQAEKSIVAPIPQYRLPGGGIQYRFLSPQEGYMNANQMMKNGWIYKF